MRDPLSPVGANPLHEIAEGLTHHVATGGPNLCAGYSSGFPEVVLDPYRAVRVVGPRLVGHAPGSVLAGPLARVRAGHVGRRDATGAVGADGFGGCGGGFHVDNTTPVYVHPSRVSRTFVLADTPREDQP